MTVAVLSAARPTDDDPVPLGLEPLVERAGGGQLGRVGEVDSSSITETRTASQIISMVRVAP